MRARTSIVRLARLAPVASVVLLALAPAGCDWRDFDDLKEAAPVLSMGPPGEFPSGDFGRQILPISGPGAGLTGGRFVVSAASTGCVAVVDVDGKGDAHGRSVCSSVFGLDTPSPPIRAMAEVPGTHDVLLGAPLADGTGSVYVLGLARNNEVTLFDSPIDGDHFGLGVAAGALAGGDAPDYVIASQAQLTVYLDGDATKPVPNAPPAADCPLELTTALPMSERLSRAVLVAPLTGGTASQIVVGTPTSSGEGAVSVFTVDATTGVATCAFAYRNAAGRFGSALATGDFNGDKVTDLLVGAPPGKAFWIAGPLAAASPVLPVTLASAETGGDLGTSVAAAELDGKPGDEALVGDGAATVDGKKTAGEVRIVTGLAPAAGMVLDKELPVLRRHDPAAGDAFGTQARVLPYCTAGCSTATPTLRPLALVGAQAHAYLYFKLFPADKDPREP